MSKLESSPVNRKFQKQINAYLSDISENIIIGVSGGPDSMALLYLFHRHHIPSVAVHCNYQLRGKSSDLDQELVEEICRLWEIECVSVRLDPEESEGANFQAWARDRRYQVFRDLKKEYNSSYIVTAHHQDDQVETILQKILRGAGMSAWKGMDFFDDNLFRPLLDVSRSEIMQFVQEFNIPYRIDRTNEESTYARNFIRNNWFPSLNKLFPGWKTNLLQITQRAEEFRLMSEKIVADISDNPQNLNREAFLKLAPEIRPVIFQSFIKKSGADVTLSKGFLNIIDQLEFLQSGKRLEMSPKYEIIRDRGQFVIKKKDYDSGSVQEISKKDIEDGYFHSFVIFEFNPPPDSFKEDELYLDVSKIQFPLTFRSWNEGDSFQPFGMEGTQLISDHLANRKVSSSEKKKTKILQSFDGTICAVIFPLSFENQLGTISEFVRCTSATKKILTLRKN